MLTLYKPWRQSSEELKHSDGTYKSTLETYMHDAKFPQRIKTAFLRVKHNKKAVDLDELTFFQEAIGTPTSDCKNENFAFAVDAIILPPSQNGKE